MHLNENLNDLVANDRDDVSQFTDLLNEAQVNSFAAWELVRDRLAVDPRYLSVSSDGQRRALYKEWAGTHRDELKPDSKSTFLAAVRDAYTGSPYPIFKRKVRSNAHFADIELPETEKANLYREYAIYTKLADNEKAQFVKERPYFRSL